MDLEVLILLGIVATYAAFALFEALRPARELPKISRWQWKGAAFLIFGLALTSVLPTLWDAWLGEHRLIDATGLGTWAGALYAFLLLELGVYAWHRAMHRTPLLWRMFHQMHHSSERIDIASSMYFHPLDLSGFSFIYSFMLVMVAGVTAEAALIANLAATFCSFFQHANVRTPAWVGYVIQRPESHSVHHQRGVHAYNYADLPLWDMVFGTFKNPAVFEGQNGFYDGASARIPEMLIGIDVSVPRAARASQMRDTTELAA
jgi:sterol desaturase/sphingolipid hydroxylase (fatty acid hydroxylase superfamily)